MLLRRCPAAAAPVSGRQYLHTQPLVPPAAGTAAQPIQLGSFLGHGPVGTWAGAAGGRGTAGVYQRASISVAPS